MIAWGIDHHGDDKVSSDLCSLPGSIRQRYDCGEPGCLSLGLSGAKDLVPSATGDEILH